MKKLSAQLILPAALLFCASARAAAPAAAPAMPAAPKAAPAGTPLIPGEMGPMSGHEGHSHGSTSDQTAEDREKVAAANKLTEAKMSGLIVLTRERNQGTSARDALAKSKLERRQAEELSFLTDTYYPARRAARQAEKELTAVRARLQAAKAAKADPAPQDLSRELVLGRQLMEHGRYRDNFLKRLSDGSRGLIERYENDFVTLLDEREQLQQKRADEARAAALKGFDEERLSRFLVSLQESAKPKPDPKVLEKATLDPKQAEGLSLLLSDYYNKKVATESDEKALADARTRLAAARAAKKPTAFDERLERYYVERIASFQAFRKDFAGKHGASFVDLLDKHSAEFIAAYKARHEKLNPPEQE